MSLLRSFVLMECAVSIVDTSSDHSTSTVKWTQIRRTSHWRVKASTISSLPSTANTTSGTGLNGFRPNAVMITRKNTSRLVSPDARGRPQNRVASHARRSTSGLPGLFKVEWCGNGFIGLCSKTYYCFGETDKSTTKGLSKRHNVIDKDTFLAVLTNRRSGSGVNRGFRVRDSSVMTYIQEKAALTYFYPKRKVLADGLTTAPLDL